MMQPRTLAPCVLLAFLSLQLSFTSSRRSDKSSSSSPRLPAGLIGKGDFTTGSKLCLWQAVEVSDTVRMEIGCDPGAFNMSGRFGMQCAYVGRPQKCSMYKSNLKTFWKRVARGFKKLQRKVCRDERAAVQAASCSRAQRDAHFRLDPKSLVMAGPIPAPPSTTSGPAIASSRPTNCTSRGGYLKTAEQYCSQRWASVCSFLLSILQSDSC